MFATKITTAMMVCLFAMFCNGQSFAKDRPNLLVLDDASVTVAVTTDDLTDIAVMPVCCGEQPGFSFTVILNDEATDFDRKFNIEEAELEFTVLGVSDYGQLISTVQLPADELDRGLGIG